MIERDKIRVRDPYILYENGLYYLYATTGDTTHAHYISHDLWNFEYDGIDFEIPEDFWAYRYVWAGEVHKYMGKYYFFVSLLGKDGKRGTQVCISESASGPFVPLVDRAVTPSWQSCIDGTFFVEDGIPYIIYSHDWPDNFVPEKDAYVGQICAARLSPDLKSIEGDPFVLFDSDEVPISGACPHHIRFEGKDTIRYGSDGPFLISYPDGKLYMVWSPYLEDHYVVLGAVSESGSVKGPWIHMEEPVFENDGGHAMVFEGADGGKYICLHSPERHGDERAHIFRLERDGDRLFAGEEISTIK